MNDETIMNNYLILLKGTTEVYVHGTLESSNGDIHDELNDDLNEILSSQNKTYHEMVKRGWYTVSNIDTNTINQTLNKLKNKE